MGIAHIRRLNFLSKFDCFNLCLKGTWTGSWPLSLLLKFRNQSYLCPWLCPNNPVRCLPIAFRVETQHTMKLLYKKGRGNCPCNQDLCLKTTLEPFNQSVKHWEVQLLVSTYVRIHRYIWEKSLARSQPAILLVGSSWCTLRWSHDCYCQQTCKVDGFGDEKLRMPGCKE